MTNTNSKIIAQLKQASEGLLFMSESEYPFVVFLWSGIVMRGAIARSKRISLPISILLSKQRFYRLYIAK